MLADNLIEATLRRAQKGLLSGRLGFIHPDGSNHEAEFNMLHDQLAKKLGYRDEKHAVSSGMVRYRILGGNVDVAARHDDPIARANAADFLRKNHREGNRARVELIGSGDKPQIETSTDNAIKTLRGRKITDTAAARGFECGG